MSTAAQPVQTPESGHTPSHARCPNRLQQWLSYLILWPLFGLATALYGFVALAASLADGTGRMQHNIARAWGGALLRITFSPVQVIGAENLRQPSAAVYAANHLSYMDTPVVLSKLPFQFRILARHDLFRIPFIGWYLQRSGQIPVDSSNLRSSVTSLNRGIQALKEGMSLVIFPEGGRSQDGSLQPFLSGLAIMAIRAQVPIVPIALVGTHELMPMHTYHLHPRPLLLIAAPAIDTGEYNTKTAGKLIERVAAEIARMYSEHACHCDRQPEQRVPTPR